jgi:PncC family amidohydrolase
MQINVRAVNKARDFLIKNKRTIAGAESVTSGNIQAALARAKDASKFFQGGMTAYNLGHKTRHLGIDPVHALECNCVSEIIAEQMAKKICDLFLADFGIGITGFASLAPEENIHELFAYISITNKEKILITQKITPRKLTAYQVQLFYTNEAIRILNLMIVTKE